MVGIGSWEEMQAMIANAVSTMCVQLGGEMRFILVKDGRKVTADTAPSRYKSAGPTDQHSRSHLRRYIAASVSSNESQLPYQGKSPRPYIAACDSW